MDIDTDTAIKMDTRIRQLKKIGYEYMANFFYFLFYNLELVVCLPIILYTYNIYNITEIISSHENFEIEIHRLAVLKNLHSFYKSCGKTK